MTKSQRPQREPYGTADPGDSADHPSSDPCHTGCEDNTQRQRVGLTGAEQMTLDLIRHVCALYSTNDARHWDAGMARAERTLGPVVGVSLVVRVTCLIRGLAAESRHKFQFHAPGCSGICSDEIAALGLIRIAGSGDANALADAAQRLCQMNGSDRIALAARSLAGLHAEIDDRETPCLDEPRVASDDDGRVRSRRVH